MSETLTQPAVDQGYQIDVSDNFANETNSQYWDQALHDLVSINQDVLVRPDWGGGTAMTLSTAMNAHPGPWSPENLPNLISEVYRLLATRVEEAEEPAEEAESEEPDKTEEPPKKDEPTKKQEESNQKSNPKPKDNDAQKKSTEERKPLIPIVKNVVQPTISENKQTADTSTMPETTQTTPSQPMRATAKAEVAAKPTHSPADITIEVGATKLEAPIIVSTTPKIPEQEFIEPVLSANDQIKEPISVATAEVSVVQTSVLSEQPSFDAGRDTDIETSPEWNKHQLIVDAEPELVTHVAGIEITTEAEIIELTPAATEDSVSLKNFAEFHSEEIESIVDQVHPVSFDHLLDTSDLINLADDEVPMDISEEFVMSFDEQHVATTSIVAAEVVEVEDYVVQTYAEDVVSEPDIFQQSENTTHEQPFQVNLVAEEVEDCLIRLDEFIKLSEPEEIRVVYEILDEIAELPIKVETHYGENTLTETKIQEELEELFIELLNRTGVEYTPELVELLVSITLTAQLDNETGVLKTQDEFDVDAQDIGTHEIINLMLAGIGTFKKATANAEAIGKSVLRLYRINLSGYFEF
ncbi:hypothetical protein KW803_02995 [Candidatus Saccharibacteria bacterium]|nr:hypothetical protein [Candidatus Saccharibacteria bacterium]